MTTGGLLDWSEVVAMVTATAAGAAATNGVTGGGAAGSKVTDGGITPVKAPSTGICRTSSVVVVRVAEGLTGEEITNKGLTGRMYTVKTAHTVSCMQPPYMDHMRPLSKAPPV